MICVNMWCIYIIIYIYVLYIYDKWWMSCGVSGGAALHCWAPSLQITRPRHGMAVICHREYRDISCRGVARCRQATRGRWKALSSVAVVGWSGSAAVGGWLIETWRASKGGKVWDGLHSHVNSRHSGKTKSRTRFRLISPAGRLQLASFSISTHLCTARR